MSQHERRRENVFKILKKFERFSVYDEFNWKFVFYVFFQQIDKIDSDSKKRFYESSIKIRKFYKFLHISMKLRYESIAYDEHSIFLHADVREKNDKF